jgi:peroxiredoxin
MKGSLSKVVLHTRSSILLIDIPDPTDEEESYGRTFWLENSRIVISGVLEDFAKAKVSGSTSQLSYEKYVTEVSNVVEKENSSYFDSISVQLTERFIKKYPSSFKSVHELYLLRQLFPFSKVKQLLAILSPQVQQSKYGKETQNFIKHYTALEAGDAAPDFTFTGLDGEAFPLQSLKGKYVLLVFWAPWCAPSMEDNKQYKHIYNIRDTSRLIMLGVSLDIKDKVVAAIKEGGIPWQNMVLVAKDGDMYAQTLLYRYGIMGVPYNILIDPQGKIIGKKLAPYYEKKLVKSEGDTKTYLTFKKELNNLLEQLNLISE